jgi:phosphatidylglycerol:prolipoprotein diacylglycerol transferase
MILINPISPIAFSIAGFGIRWYALAYIAAFAVGFFVLKKMLSSDSRFTIHDSRKQLDDLFTALILGVIIGGRLGYVLFYNLPFFLNHPLEIFAVWHGGMSFHGGLMGVIFAVFLQSKKQQKLQSAERKAQSAIKENRIALRAPRSAHSQIQNTFSVLDLLSVIAPIGLFFGRIANFINMEVMGRATTGPLGVVFIGAADQTPRYPSPLFEAALEGIALFFIMFCLWKFTKLRDKIGTLSGLFAIFYAVFRIFAEQFRQPDEQLGFLTSWGLTMGQLLSACMLVAGAAVFAVAMKKGNKK